MDNWDCFINFSEINSVINENVQKNCNTLEASLRKLFNLGSDNGMISGALMKMITFASKFMGGRNLTMKERLQEGPGVGYFSGLTTKLHYFTWGELFVTEVKAYLDDEKKDMELIEDEYNKLQDQMAKFFQEK